MLKERDQLWRGTYKKTKRRLVVNEISTDKSRITITSYSLLLPLPCSGALPSSSSSSPLKSFGGKTKEAECKQREKERETLKEHKTFFKKIKIKSFRLISHLLGLLLFSFRRSNSCIRLLLFILFLAYACLSDR